MLAHSSSVSTSPKFIITCLSSVLEMNPLPANQELYTKCTLPPKLFERSSKPTVDIKDTESLSDVHFCCKGINLCRITDHVTKHNPRLSAISSLLINILLISFVLQNIVGTNCNSIVCPHLTCHQIQESRKPLGKRKYTAGYFAESKISIL